MKRITKPEKVIGFAQTYTTPDEYEAWMMDNADGFTLSIPRLGQSNPDHRVEVTKDNAEMVADELFQRYPQTPAILLYGIIHIGLRQAQIATVLPKGSKPKNFPGKIKPRQWIVGDTSGWWIK